MQIAARLAVHQPAPEARRMPRTSVNVPAELLQNGYHGFDVVVRDINSLGFRLDSQVRVKAKALVRLRLPGLGMVLGRVVWCRKGCIGGEFVNPIAESRLRTVIGYRAQTVAPRLVEPVA
jgi:hypothetical protein